MIGSNLRATSSQRGSVEHIWKIFAHINDFYIQCTDNRQKKEEMAVRSFSYV